MAADLDALRQRAKSVKEGNRQAAAAPQEPTPITGSLSQRIAQRNQNVQTEQAASLPPVEQFTPLAERTGTRGDDPRDIYAPVQGRGNIDTVRAAAKDVKQRYAAFRAEDEAIKAQEKKTYDDLLADFGSMAEGRHEDVRNWDSVARSVIGLRAAVGDDPEAAGARDTANAIMAQYGEQVRPYIELQAGTEWWDENFEPPPEPSFWNKAIGAGAGLLEALDAPREGLFRLAQGALGNSDLGDINEDGRTDLFEVFGKTPKEGSAGIDVNLPFLGERRIDLTGITSLTGDIVFDPLTYVGLGLVGKAGKGIKAIEGGAALRAAAQGGDAALTQQSRRIVSQIRQSGWKSLDVADKELAETLIRESVADGIQRYALTKGDLKLTQRVRPQVARAQDKVAAAIDSRAQQLTQGVQRGGQSGVRVAGQTVLPTGGLGLRGRMVFDDPLANAVALSRRQAVDLNDAGLEELLTVLPGIRSAADAQAIVAWRKGGGVFNAVDDLTSVKGIKGARLQQILEGADDVILHGVSDMPKTAATMLKFTPKGTFVPGLLTSLADNAIVRGLADRFVPRAAILRNRALGREAADALDDATSQVMAGMEADIKDAARRLDAKVVKGAINELQGNSQAFIDVVDAALTSEHRLGQAIEAATKAGNTNLAQTLTILGDIQTSMGGKLPRIVKRDSIRRLNRALEGQEGARQALVERGLLHEGGEVAAENLPFDKADDAWPFTRQTTGEVNEASAKIISDAGLDPESIGELFETNAMRSFAVGNRFALENTAKARIASVLADMGDVDLAGAPLARVFDTTESFSASAFARQAKYVKMNLPDGRIAVMNRELSAELGRVNRLLGSRADLNHLASMVDKWNSVWASYATVPLIGAGFHARNAAGNIFNAFLSGLRNPQRFVEAADLQWANGRIQREMSSTGASWADAARALDLDAKDIRLLESARAKGVIGSGQTSDIFLETRGGVAPGLGEGGVRLFSREGIRGSRLSPFSQRNPVLASGRQVGQAIEDNARLAVYLNELAKGATERNAAATVRRYLFDYSDLTRFESENLRSFSRFYTFMRKNTALQAQMLAAHPGLVTNAQEVVNSVTEMLFGGGEDPTFIPEWAQRAGLQVNPEGTQLVGLETPFQAAGETIDQLSAATGAVLGVPLPGMVQYGDREDQFGQALGLMSGGPVAFIDFLYGGRFGADPFSRRPLENDGMSEWIRRASTVIPAFAKLDREIDKVQEGGFESRYGNWIFGMQQYDIDEDQQGRALSGLKHELFDAISEAEAAGVAIPSVDELREAGDIANVNRVLQALVLTRDAEGSPAGREDDVQKALDSIIGREALEYLDLIGDEDLTSPEKTDAEIEQIVREMRDAMEIRLGRKLTDEEARNIVLMNRFAPTNTELRGAGLEPYTTANIFDTKETTEADAADVQQRLQRVAAIYGVSADEFQPLLTKAERAVRDGQARGMSQAEITDHLISELSRSETNYMFGPDELEKFRLQTYTEEDAEKVRRRAWERRSEFSIIWESLTGTLPPEDALTRYLYWNELTVGQQQSLGLERQPKTPGRKDITPDEEKLRIARQRLIDSTQN